MALTDCEVTLLNIGKIFGPSMLSALVAFWLFRKTTKRDREKDEAKVEKERLNRVKYLIHIGDESLKMMAAQVEDFETHIELLKEQSFQPVQLGYHNKRNCELLIELITSESTFEMFAKTQFNGEVDKLSVYSKISSKSAFIDTLLNDIIKGAMDYMNYTSEQTTKIQSYIDGILKTGNTLLLSLQRKEQIIDIDKYYIDNFKAIGDYANSQNDRGLRTFYEHFTLPLESIFEQCKKRHFSDIEQLLEVIRERDKAHRSYNELLSSWSIYLATFQERTQKLKEESAELKILFDMLKKPI